MKRRSFIKTSLGAAAVPIFVNGLPMQLLANGFTKMAAASTNNRVVVIIQLMGGNDGLNTLVPVDQYNEYFDLRPNIAIPDTGSRKYIPLNPTDPPESQLGLHPDMSHFKEMYDDDRVTIVQNVAYDNPDMSHFRGRDIWFMGGGSTDNYHSGWLGRYLDGTYEGYPDEYPNEEMPDPLGLEFGFNQSLLFQREQGIPAGLAILDPDTFYQLTSGAGIDPPDWLPDSYYGDEMAYLMDLELKSNQYADRIKEVYENGSNSENVVYPETYPGEVEEGYQTNDLAWQLKAVAKLLSGGSKTKTFLVKLNGFDTHADQTLDGNSTEGIHAALLYHLSSAVKAFYDDMKDQGFEHRVLTLTTSEFGRRVESNASFGTDHGTAAPQLLFGPMLKHRLIGNPPNLSDLIDGNLKHAFDYRQIYTGILMDWMEAPPEIVDEVLWSDFVDSRLELFHDAIGYPEENRFTRIDNLKIYPNPASGATHAEFSLNKPGHIELSLFDLNGRNVAKIFEGQKSSGKHQISFSVASLESGYYLLRLKSGFKIQSKKLIVQ